MTFGEHCPVYATAPTVVPRPHSTQWNQPHGAYPQQPAPYPQQQYPYQRSQPTTSAYPNPVSMPMPTAGEMTSCVVNGVTLLFCSFFISTAISYAVSYSAWKHSLSDWSKPRYSVSSATTTTHSGCSSCCL